MNPETKTILHPGPATKRENLAAVPYRKIKANRESIKHIQCLPSGHWIIIYSGDTISYQLWNLGRCTLVGEEWEVKKGSDIDIVVSPDGKTLVASGDSDGAVELLSIDTGKVIKRWTGHTEQAWPRCWSPDGERVVDRCPHGMFRVWDIKSGKTMLGPIKAGRYINAVCYSPDAKMIATGGDVLKVWDASTGGLLKTFGERCSCLAWTSNGKTLVAGGSTIKKFDTTTWSEIAVLDRNSVNTISLSPNGRILATTSYSDSSTARLWNLETNQPIGTPLHHDEYGVNCTSFSVDGKFLVTTSCKVDYVYMWDLSVIVKDASLLSHIADVTPRLAPKTTGARRIPPGFFADALRDANSRVLLSQSNGPSDSPTPAPRQRTLSRISSFWHRSKPHGATERDTQPRRTRNLVSGMMRRRHGSDIDLQEPPVVDVPCTAGRPRNYHAGRKPAISSSRPSKTPHTTQQHNGAAQSTPLSQISLPTAPASTLSPVAGAAETTGTVPRPDITVRQAGWWTRLILWGTCASVEYTINE